MVVLVEEVWPWLDFLLDFLCLDFFVVERYDESADFPWMDGVVLLEGWSDFGFFGMGGVSSSSYGHGEIKKGAHIIILQVMLN